MSGRVSRIIIKNVFAKEQSEGRGAKVRRSLGRPEVRNHDPFLLLDEFNVSLPGGFPDHPHRGFETVTYMMKGAFVHEDFLGNTGIINDGDVQWMTAGRGVVHSEMPASEEPSYGLQLWVNLPKELKMIKPAYQDLKAKDIPSITHKEVKAVIIAGDFLGLKGKASTKIPILYVDLTIAKGGTFTHAIKNTWNAMIYVLEGSIFIGPPENQTECQSHHLGILGVGNSIEFQNKGDESCRFVLIAGQPINEPIVQQGVFVMNSDEEIKQAFEDYYSSKNGFDNRENWKSKRGFQM